MRTSFKLKSTVPAGVGVGWGTILNETRWRTFFCRIETYLLDGIVGSYSFNVLVYFDSGRGVLTSDLETLFSWLKFSSFESSLFLLVLHFFWVSSSVQRQQLNEC
jgi:hypothetical protein